MPPGSSNPDPISEKKCYFPHPFSDLVSKIHTRFQTWKRVTKRNITCLHKTEIMSSLLRLKPPQKDFFNTISNSHITLSFLIIWNWNDEQTDTQPSSLVNHTRFPTKMGKNYTRFHTKTAQNLYPFGGTYVSGSYKGVPLPPPPLQRLSCLVHFVNNANYATGWFAIWNLSNCECQYLSFVSNKIICLPSIKLISNVTSNKLKWTLKTRWANKFSKTTIAINFNLLQALSIRDSGIFHVLFIPSFNV